MDEEVMKAAAYGLRQRHKTMNYTDNIEYDYYEPRKRLKTKKEVQYTPGIRQDAAAGWRRAEALCREVGSGLEAAKDGEYSQWTPEDDALLCEAVTAIGDFGKIYEQMRFSQRFTMRHMMDRWYGLLYDKELVNASLATRVAKRQHPFSGEEDALIMEQLSRTSSLDEIQAFIENNRIVFDHTRTAQSLEERICFLLRRNPRNIVATKTSTLPILYRVSGKHMNVHVRQPSATWGRTAPDVDVDVDFALEGAASKVSRVHCLVSKQSDGKYVLEVVGKRDVVVDGKTMKTKDKITLRNRSKISIGGLEVQFHVL